MIKKEYLAQVATDARQHAYVPYSHFKVGAALLLKGDVIITGSNIENSSYGLCNCAERSALFAAYSKGYRKDDILAMAVSADTEGPCSPCGACRQVMSELLNEDTPIILTNVNGAIMETTIKDLLPYAFSEDDLK